MKTILNRGGTFGTINRLRSVTLIVAGVFFNTNSFSQNWLWAKSGSGPSTGYSVSADASGNVFVTGYFENPGLSFGSINLSSAGAKDVFIAKYDASGTVLWAKCAGGTNDDYGHSVSTDKNGNVFVTGFFKGPTITFGSTTLTNTSAGSKDIFIAKYDAGGTLLWAQRAGGTSDDYGYSLSTDVTGNLFVTGYFKSPIATFGSATISNAVPTGLTMDVFVVKYNANGTVLWASRAGAANDDVGYSVSADGGGNVFVTGYFSTPTITFGPTILTNSGSYDLFIAKYDANGTVLWAKRGGGTANDVGYSVSADPAGNVFITGYFESNTITFGTTILTNLAAILPSDAFIAKYDANGNVLWAKRAGGAHNDVGYSVSADASGNVFVSGYFGSASITFGSTSLNHPAVGSGDPLFIVKYDGGGNVICASSLSSGGNENNCVSADPFGNVYLGGNYAANPLIVGSDTLPLTGGTGARNVFVSKYTCNSSILMVAVTTTNPPCNGQCNGIAIATPVNGTPPYTYLWSPAGQTTSAISGLCTGSYTVLVTDAVKATTKASVTVFQPAVLALTTTVTNMCSGSTSGTATVTPTGGTASYAYNWNNGQTLPVATGLGVGMYTVTVTDINGCTNTTTALINTLPPPAAVITGNTTICSGQTALLTGSGGGTYSWNNGLTAKTISVKATSSYTLTVTDANGCTGSATATVNVMPLPIVNAWNDTIILLGQSATLSATCLPAGTGGGSPYQWSNGATDSVIVVSPDATTKYCVTVTNANNCKASACVTVTVEQEKCPEPYLPNAFSPNSDGENDALQIYHDNIACIKNFKLIIYDRWAEKVYETDDKFFQWNGYDSRGIFRGEEATAVFVYRMKVSLIDGTSLVKSGNISLVK